MSEKFLEKLLNKFFGEKGKWILSETCNNKKWKFGIKRVNWGMCYDYDLFIFELFSKSYYFKGPKLHPYDPLDRTDDEYMYGFYFWYDGHCCGDGLDFVYGWGKQSRYYLPYFTWDWQRTEYISHDGRVIYKDNKNQKTNFSEIEKFKHEHSKDYSYTYTLENGKIQNVIANVVIEKRYYSRKWFPFIKKSFHSIWVTFSESIGENVDSWKGGVTGCGWDILEGETAEESLRRMEKERKFKRK